MQMLSQEDHVKHPHANTDRLETKGASMQELTENLAVQSASAMDHMQKNDSE